MHCFATHIRRAIAARLPRCTRMLACILFVAAAGTFELAGSRQATAAPQFGGSDTTTRIRERSYCYRTYCVMYDSVSVCCSFGEMCLPLRDSAAIEALTYAVEPVDVAPEQMGTVCRSRPFDLDEATVLSLWRGLHLQQEAWVYHYSVHDTCSWILRLHDERDGRVLATLDSVGYLPSQITQWGEYPGIFGLDNSEQRSHGMLTYTLGRYAEQGVERAWVSVSVVVQGNNARGCTLRDQTLEERISTTMQQK